MPAEYWTANKPWKFAVGSKVRDTEGDIWIVTHVSEDGSTLNLVATEGGLKQVFGVSARYFHNWPLTS